MISGRRVVVTGMGMVTPLGVGVSSTWKAITEGRSGVGDIDRYLERKDPRREVYAAMPSRVAAMVPRGKGSAELFDADWHKSSEFRVLSLAMKFGLMAAEEAVNDAKWSGEGMTEEQKKRTGVSVGMAMADLEYIAECNELVMAGKSKKMGPYFVPRILPNLVPGHISIAHGFRGPNNSVSTACATGSHAIGDGYRFIQSDSADVMVCGGTDACISPLSVAGFVRARALSTKYNDRPEAASRPFDKKRDGFVIGEGAGILVLEELNHALDRGADIYAEIVGYGASGDASHITAGRDDGGGALMAMKDAIRQYDLDDLWMVNAHATSTPKGDNAEVAAVRRLLKSRSGLRPPFMVSHKGQLGHMLGAAGSTESALALLSLRHGLIPANANLETLDDDLDDCEVRLVRENVFAVDDGEWNSRRRLVLKNSFGFGGTNVSLLFSEFKN
jgi:3-oxoacyl-[acyl-carrier-protein] synthase II